MVLLLQKQVSGGTFVSKRFKSTASRHSPWFENSVFSCSLKSDCVWRGGRRLHYRGLAAGGVRNRGLRPPSPSVALTYGLHLIHDRLIYIFIFCLLFTAYDILCYAKESEARSQGDSLARSAGCLFFNVPPLSRLRTDSYSFLPDPLPPPPDSWSSTT
ncbi:hypothetical protein E2C01_039178 [Portunus trituberculatus]|uniref:Uncharacterized protein n=1 Tax=Portunus trituberculatus TaxID=210409 RepID=A0A5B7FJY5_PORTR|nr:hypothetical protein [Portunus trituberculatus]